ncbi:MAG: ATP-dependent Clp protease proteolytic subunit [Calditrichaeota bacterium]|nr:ATP-dependent Clp protease proteolytic subunit [Calditrichota bacterium]MCB0266816.1 ATP-dependent Clp protease proteolytic subunit [Calditrichota bacterium]MCB0299201.1 ATP-dependent Clp protease proteolytic subunit [Calditrichota bacterium]MCB9066600.1 ATP-dependent Clp protease proteolytic subunit [Calditrichia bacterium]
MNEDWLELSPKEKEEKEDKKDEKKPYSVDQKLMESRTITIYGGIDQKLAKDVCQRLLALAAESDEPIKLYLHSQGGHVESGDSIFDMIRFIKPEVKIIGTGWVASAGALIFASADKKNRFCMPNTRFLLHQPSGGVMGQATDIGIEAKEIVKMRRRLNEIFADATGQPIEQIEKQTDRNFWMTADEAVKYGLVTKIVKSADEVK